MLQRDMIYDLKKKVLGWPKSLGFSIPSSGKNSNHLLGQPNKMWSTQSDGGEGKDGLQFGVIREGLS